MGGDVRAGGRGHDVCTGGVRVGRAAGDPRPAEARCRGTACTGDTHAAVIPSVFARWVLLGAGRLAD